MANKYYKEQRYKSEDGIHWIGEDVYQKGALIEKDSPWCSGRPYKYWYKSGYGGEYMRECGYGVHPERIEVPELQWVRLEEIVIGDCVKEIGESAFDNYTMRNSFSAFTSCIMSDSVTSIGPSAFAGCSALTNCQFGNNVSTIGYGAFGNCTSLTSITIPDSVTTIGFGAFSNCSGLTSIDIPNSVTSLEGSHGLEGMFENCISLTSATIGSGLTSIGDRTFYNCTSLENVIIPDSVTSISASAFYHCTSLTSITIPDSVTTIYGGAFSGCSSLTNLTIGSGITSIAGIGAFQYCTSLTSITINATTPPALGRNVFNNTNNCPIYVPCGSVNAYKTASGWSRYASRIACMPKWYAYYTNNEIVSAGCDSTHSIASNEISSYTQNLNALKDVKIYDCVTAIDNYAFYYYGTLTGITIPTSVTTIGSMTFAYCTGLTTIEFVGIQDSLTSYGSMAFGRCTSLTSLTIPSSVTNISTGAFYDCSGLTSITVEALTPPELGNNVFDNTNDCPIYVPCGKLQEYKTAWSAYASRISCPPEPKWYAHYSTHTESGACGTSALTENEITLTNLLSVDIMDCVMSIDSNALKGCTSLSAVTIPNSVTSIGDSAFQDCSSLTSIDIPNSVTTIGSSALKGCASLSSVAIPNSVTSIGSQAFASCLALSSITIPTSVTTLGSLSFANCTSLTSLTIPSSVTSIGVAAFGNCSGLTSITIESEIPQTLGTSAFDNTSNCPIYVPCDSVMVYKEAWSDYASRITCTNPPTIYRWVVIDGEYECSGTTKMTKEKKQQSSDFGDTWVDVSPEETRMGSSIIEFYSLDCGYVPLERWVIVDGEYTCSGTTKMTKEKKQLSYDDGNSWVDASPLEVRTGSTVVEYNSFDCGYVPPTEYRWVVASGEYLCSGTTKVTKEKKQQSTDGGYTWADVSPEESRAVMPVIEYNSLDCGYTPPPPPPLKWFARYTNGTTAQRDCEENTSILPNEITKNGLLTIKIGDCTTSLTSGAFYNSYSLTSCTSGVNVTYIGTAAFQGCSSLLNIDIPSGLTSMGGYAFQGCSKIKNISLPNSVTTIGNNAFSNCSALSSMTLPNSITTIPYAAFYWCESLTGITIPNTVTTIGDYAFYTCSGMTGLVIPSSVTSIGEIAFGICQSLRYVIIQGDNIAHIGLGAFYNCVNLESIIINATTPPELEYDVFEETNECPIFVPAASVNAYKTAEYWDEYADRIYPIT